MDSVRLGIRVSPAACEILQPTYKSASRLVNDLVSLATLSHQIWIKNTACLSPSNLHHISRSETGDNSPSACLTYGRRTSPIKPASNKHAMLLTLARLVHHLVGLVGFAAAYILALPFTDPSMHHRPGSSSPNSCLAQDPKISKPSVQPSAHSYAHPHTLIHPPCLSTDPGSSSGSCVIASQRRTTCSALGSNTCT